MAKPEKISVSRSKKVLEILWDDGHHTEISLTALRAACPCAECKSEGQVADPDPLALESSDLMDLPILSSASTEIDHLEVLGNYSLQIYWKDGHSYGIYSWDYLRELCMCEDCREEES